MSTDLDAVVAGLRAAGARFAHLHGSRAEGTARPDSDVDVGAHSGGGAPPAWAHDLPGDVDLVVLDSAPLYLAGRIALRGQLLFDDPPGSPGRPTPGCSTWTRSPTSTPARVST